MSTRGRGSSTRHVRGDSGHGESRPASAPQPQSSLHGEEPTSREGRKRKVSEKQAQLSTYGGDRTIMLPPDSLTDDCLQMRRPKTSSKRRLILYNVVSPVSKPRRQQVFELHQVHLLLATAPPNPHSLSSVKLDRVHLVIRTSPTTR